METHTNLLSPIGTYLEFNVAETVYCGADERNVSASEAAEILVFKTNIHDSSEINIMYMLNSLKGIKSWNVDLEDCDKVLRVESKGITPHKVISTINNLGYQCREL